MTRDYLFLKRHPLATWRELAQSTHQAQYQRLLKQADSYHDILPPPEHPSDSITYIGMAVMNLGLAYLLSADAAYLDTARRWIQVAINYPHWGKERMPDHDLDAAWLLFGLSLGYDWLKADLPVSECEALRDKLVHQAAELYRFAVETEGSWWSSAYWQNHNWICYGGLATAAYTLMDDTPDAQQWANRARDNFRQALALMPEDGSDYEGPVYWRYGFMWFLIYADLLQQETGESLHDSGFLRNAFWYRLYLSAPNLVDTANFGDCHDRRSSHSAAVYARLASLYNIAEAQFLYQHFYETGEWEREGREGLVKPGLLAEAAFEFLWYDAQTGSSPLNELPYARVFPDLGLVSVRTSWENDAVMLAFKCGAPNGMKAWHSGQSLNHERNWQTISAGHNHADENSFILIKGDDYLAVDEGYSKAKLTRHHSTLLIDGQGQYAEGEYNAFRQLDETWGGRLEDWFIQGSLAYSRGEAARAYHPDFGLQQFTREMLFLDGDAVILHDTIAAHSPHKFEWLLQTDNPAETIDNQTFGIESGASRFTVHALQPQGVQAETLEAVIEANPTSAKPDWIIRRTQYALALSPAEPVAAANYFVVLNLCAAQVEAVAASRGHVCQVKTAHSNWYAGFARGKTGILSDTVHADAAWFVGQWQDEHLVRYMAGDVTSLWLEGKLHFVADVPLKIIWAQHRHHGNRVTVLVESAKAAWIRLRHDKPNTVQMNHKLSDYQYDAATQMVWVHIAAGQTTLVIA